MWVFLKTTFNPYSDTHSDIYNEALQRENREGGESSDCIHWQRGVWTHKGAVGIAEHLSPILRSVTGKTEQKVSKGTCLRGKKPIFIRIHSDAFLQLQSHCKHRLQGIVCKFYQWCARKENNPETERRKKIWIWGFEVMPWEYVAGHSAGCVNTVRNQRACAFKSL